MRKTPSFADTDTMTLLRSLVEAFQEISRKDACHSSRWDLATSEFDVIATLGNTDGMRMTDLARRTLTTKSNITRVVKDLMQRGLVERERNPECEREVVVRLTESGERLFVESYPQKYQFLKAMFDRRLERCEQQQLIHLLRRLLEPTKPDECPTAAACHHPDPSVED